MDEINWTLVDEGSHIDRRMVIKHDSKAIHIPGYRLFHHLIFNGSANFSVMLANAVTTYIGLLVDSSPTVTRTFRVHQ